MSRKFDVYNQQIWCRAPTNPLYVDRAATLLSRLSTENSLTRRGNKPPASPAFPIQTRKCVTPITGIRPTGRRRRNGTCLVLAVSGACLGSPSPRFLILYPRVSPGEPAVRDAD